jgi:magnesium chelatase subunit D
VSGARDPARHAIETAILAARIFAADPRRTGIVLRGGAGPQCEEWLALLRGLMAGRPVRKLPLNIADDRLLGGLDLAATLARGRLVAERGLLAETDGGALIVPSAERAGPDLAARIAAVHDRGELRSERDGLAQTAPARFGLVLLDESLGGGEHPPMALMDRAAMRIDLGAIRPGALTASAKDVEPARAAPSIDAPDAAVEALCRASAALGIASIRAPLLALRVARIAAALDGREAIGEEDMRLAGELVLSWRALALPEAEDDAEDGEPPPDAGTQPDTAGPSDPATAEALADMVVEAARAALPPDLLARLAMEQRQAARQAASGPSGAPQKSMERGRRIGVMHGDPRRGARLDLVATLRAAAPWQRLRKPAAASRAPLRIHSSDLRIARFARRAETLTVFAVDASGSQALNRMAEAKGAVERLLGECYVRRDQVALIAFGGRRADLILPPTRSLARAKRCLTGLPAGGGTPLAAGIEAAFLLAQSARRRGQTPLIAVLTDGRANIARDGQAGRQPAEADAAAAARLLRASGCKALLIDTSPLPEPRAKTLAEAMGAVYLALPRIGSGGLSQAVEEARG